MANRIQVSSPHTLGELQEFKRQVTVSNCKHGDSVEKLFSKIALLATVPVVYNGKQLSSRPVRSVMVSPTVFRRFVCPNTCISCCVFNFTLDFLPNEVEGLEPWLDTANRHPVIVNGQERQILTVHKSHPACDLCGPMRGALGCSIWKTIPLECKSAPQVQIMKYKDTARVVGKPFSRGWNFAVKPECKFEKVSTVGEGSIEDVLGVLRRYQVWSDYFKIPTVLPQIINRLEADSQDKAASVPVLPVVFEVGIHE
jgi:hypothetical protein